MLFPISQLKKYERNGNTPIIFDESLTRYFSPILQLPQEPRLSLSATEEKCKYHRSLYMTLFSHLPPSEK